MDLKPIYFGFDGLDVTFQGRIRRDFVEVLEMAKVEAMASRAPALISYHGVQMHVAETGARGGYAYRVDTGPEGAVWFFSRSDDPQGWNIRVSCKSAWLATKGFGRVRTEIYEFLEQIGADVLGESIARVDYAMDFRADDLGGFTLDPFAFVMHSHTSRADHAEDVDMHGISGRYTSVTVGKMPGRQVIVYDKTKEVVAHRKAEWLGIWAAALDKAGGDPLEPGDRVWRVELRAGKEHLKERWGITTWRDLDDKLGDLFARALDDIRYAVATADTNRARWPDHPMWSACRAVVAGDLFEMVSGATPGVVKQVRRRQLAQTMQEMILGLVATWTLATGTPAKADTIAPSIAKMTADYLQSEGEEFRAKMRRASNRYVFICQEETNGGIDCQVPPDLGGSGAVAADFDSQGDCCAADHPIHDDGYVQPAESLGGGQ